MKKQEQYSVGIYCRLSKDDIGSGDSSSIISQKCMLEKYVQDNGWAVYDFYIDDGYSGMSYDIQRRFLKYSSIFQTIFSSPNVCNAS